MTTSELQMNINNQIHQLKTLFHQLPLQIRHLEWFPIPYKIEFDLINYYLHFLCSSRTPILWHFYHSMPLPSPRFPYLLVSFVFPAT